MAGDTIASALFASGVTIFSRSFKYHRARGLYDNQGYGAEVLVSVNGAPNLLADRVPAHEGLQVETQNAWPSVEFDLMAINDSAVPLLPNGFYYKMFHKPKWAWPFFESMIRKAAGLGKLMSRGAGSTNGTRSATVFPICAWSAADRRVWRLLWPVPGKEKAFF